MKDLIIVGTGGFGKEVAWLAETTNEFRILGFLDDNPNIGDHFFNYPVLGRVVDANQYQGASFAIAIGSPRIRSKVQKILSDLKIQNFPNLISPNAIISKYITIGSGNIICAGVIATTDISIGDFNIVNLNTTIGHDCVISNFVTLAPLCAISGNVTLNNLSEVGTAASIKQGLSVSEGSMLGMGGVLTKNIEENNQIFIGNPAKFFKTF